MGAMMGDSSRETALEKVHEGSGISDQTGAPEDIAKMLRDPKTKQAGFRKMARWDGLLVPEEQILYEDVPYFRVRGRLAAAKMNMDTGVITFTNAADGGGDFWVALSNMRHEYGHWLDWKFNLGYPERYEIRAYEFQIRDHNFGRTPTWYQSAIRNQLHIEQRIYMCKERATC